MNEQQTYKGSNCLCWMDERYACIWYFPLSISPSPWPPINKGVWIWSDFSFSFCSLQLFSWGSCWLVQLWLALPLVCGLVLNYVASGDVCLLGASFLRIPLLSPRGIYGNYGTGTIDWLKKGDCYITLHTGSNDYNQYVRCHPSWPSLLFPTKSCKFWQAMWPCNMPLWSF